ncbi:MAG: metal ABC transporter permease [Actinomycetota bacterium]
MIAVSALPHMIASGIFSYPFMVNAFRAGTIVAVLAGALGWFMVLRGQTFAGHTLSVVGFPGAAAATLLGVSPWLGYFAFCTGAALVIAALPAGGRRGGFSDESAVIGSVQALLLASGFLFVSLYAGNLNGLNSLLFGSFLGITPTQVLTLLIVSVPALLALGVIARPLLFASIESDVAAASGVPVRAVSIAFLVLLGVAVAEASQITGSLLVFALLVLPPASAQAITARPARAAALSVIIAVAVTWAGLAAAYYSSYPTGVFITSFSFGVYVVARAAAIAASRTRRLGPAAEVR